MSFVYFTDKIFVSLLGEFIMTVAIFSSNIMIY